MIIIKNFPFPPSANEMYATNVHKFRDPAGKMRVKTSRRRSEILEKFYENCEKFKSINRNNMLLIRSQIQSWVNDGKVIGMDCFVIVERSRIFTRNGYLEAFDADNRRKALQDGICSIIGIDDKYVFRGITEKVTCDRKDLECAIIKIYPMNPTNLENLQL